ncbi:MAG: ammonium transporter, partial [Actinobacteria bacterium]|nr:ammonium transporter [Actinomycetota bacterium]
GGSGQLWAQLISMATVIIWGIGSSWIFWKIIDKIMKIRVKAADEIAGLDLPEMGVLAYPDFLLSTSQGKDGFGMEQAGGKK